MDAGQGFMKRFTRLTMSDETQKNLRERTSKVLILATECRWAFGLVTVQISVHNPTGLQFV